MANHYYGISLGGGIGAGAVSTGTSTTSKNVELVVLDGVTGMNKTELVKAILAIAAYIKTAGAPA